MARRPITKRHPYTPSRGALAGRTFTSERQYRAALARRMGFRSLGAQERARRPVFTRTDELRLRPAARQARLRALDALSIMRREFVSLSGAARRTGTTPNTILRHVGTAVHKSVHGRYVAKATDRLYRRMQFLRPGGPITLEVTNSRTASKIGEYLAAVHDYLDSGRTTRLRKFRGKSIRVGKITYPFVTDPKTLERLHDAGVISFEDLYASIV